SVKVYDHAGNVSVDTLQVKVDTGKPSSTFISPVNGSENNLARAIFPMSGTSTDALSGVSRAELSVDEGRTWNSLILSDGKWTYDLNTIDLADGVYKVVVRTTDLAGNTDTLETSTAFVSLLVSNGRPQIKLTPEWFVWQSGSLSIHSEYFPLKGGMVTISDPQRRWPKVEIPFDENYPKSITWDRRFANGILATSGDYDVAVTACNTYNRCSNKRATIKIPWIAVIIPVPSPTTPVVVTPEKPVVEEIPERSSIPPVVPLETSPAPQIKQHNTSGRTPPAPVQIALALVTLIALLWAVASASLSDRRPVAINAIAKTISEAR
ncbi:MAG: Ig-like domain-containing protein, partial [Bacteroidota bacterium]